MKKTMATMIALLFLTFMLFTSCITLVKAEKTLPPRQTEISAQGDYETSPGFWVLYTWAWHCLEKEQVEDYLNAAEITLWLDGKEVEIEASDIHESDYYGIPTWAVRFSFWSHPLPKGEHLFLTEVILHEEVYDGLDYYGPGAWNFFSYVTVALPM